MPDKTECKEYLTASHYLEVRGYIVEDVSESVERNQCDLNGRGNAEELQTS